MFGGLAVVVVLIVIGYFGYQKFGLLGDGAESESGLEIGSRTVLGDEDVASTSSMPIIEVPDVPEVLDSRKLTLHPVGAKKTEAVSEKSMKASEKIQVFTSKTTSSEVDAQPSRSSADDSLVPVKNSCKFLDSPQALAPSSRTLMFNEIAWMGSVPQDGETAAKAGNREWIELKNISPATVDVSGWHIFDSAGSMKITIGDGVKIPAGGFYLLARNGVSSLPASTTLLSPATAVDAEYTGGLSNAGDGLELFSPECVIQDMVAASSGWPGGNNITKQTLERDADGIGWHTSAVPGGTPRAENSAPLLKPALASTTAQKVSSTSVMQATVVTPQPQQYLISVSFTGAGMGSVSSSPAGILCGFSCQANFASGTKLSLVASPAQGSWFKGWSGACKDASAESCLFSVSSLASLAADFELTETSQDANQVTTSDGQNNIPSSTSTSTSPTSSSASVNHLIISEILIAGASSSNDYVKIFNPMSASVDLSGWKLRKRSSAGTEYSLRTFVSGNAIAPGVSYMWANSAGGFAAAIGADASSTETLAADNSVALINASGSVEDAVAWGTGTNQFVEGAAFPTNPTAGQVLARKIEGGIFVDTGQNANDFGVK
jgi:hypothetical protein